MFVLVTVKYPRNPVHPIALGCRHDNYRAGHCAEMACANYVSSCPRHKINGGDQDDCSRGKATAPCPFTKGTCTDATGEHHTGLFRFEDVESARIHFANLGMHVTRVEAVSMQFGDDDHFGPTEMLLSRRASLIEKHPESEAEIIAIAKEHYYEGVADGYEENPENA